MFAYALNNPILFADQQGDSATVAGLIIGFIGGGIGALTHMAKNGEEANWNKVLECATLGAMSGAAAGLVADLSVTTCGAATAVIASAAAGGAFSFLNSAESQRILKDGDVDWVEAAYNGFIGAAMGGLCTAIGDIGKPVASSLKEGFKHVSTQVAVETTALSVGKTTAKFWFDVGGTAVTSFGSYTFGLAYDRY